MNVNRILCDSLRRAGWIAAFLVGGVTLSAGSAYAQSFYVADSYNGVVDTVSGTGAVSTYATDPNGPVGIIQAPGSSVLYETNNTNNAISVITSGGTVSTFSNSSLLNAPVGLDFDSSGNLYVANSGGNDILKFTNTGGTLSSSPSIFTSTSLNSPEALAFSSGYLYASNLGSNSITQINASTGAVTATFSSGLLSSPVGLAFSPSGTLYIANSSSIVTLNTATGTFATFTSDGNYPYALGFDGAGDLFASEANGSNFTGQVVKFTNTGGTLSTTPTTVASGLGQANFLAGLNINGPNTSATPEPGVATLMLSGVAALGGVTGRIRRRRNRSQEDAA